MRSWTYGYGYDNYGLMKMAQTLKSGFSQHNFKYFIKIDNTLKPITSANRDAIEIELPEVLMRENIRVSMILLYA